MNDGLKESWMALFSEEKKSRKVFEAAEKKPTEKVNIRLSEKQAEAKEEKFSFLDKIFSRASKEKDSKPEERASVNLAQAQQLKISPLFDDKPEVDGFVEGEKSDVENLDKDDESSELNEIGRAHV